MVAGLRIKVLLPLVSLSLLLLAYLYGYWMPSSLANIEDKYRISAERHIDSVAEALVPLLLARQLDTVYGDLDTLRKRNTDWVSVRLFDDKGRMIYPLKTPPPAVRSGTVSDIRIIEKQIDYLDMHLGRLVVDVDFAPRLSAIRKRHLELITIMLIIIVGYVIAASFILDWAAVRPVNLLAHAARSLARGDFSAAMPKRRNDEVGTLVNSFSSMRDTIRSYQTDLKAAGSYNRSLIEASLDPLVTIDADGKITDVNAATEKVTGRTRAELIGTDFSDYFTEAGKARAGYQQVFREGAVRDYPLEIKNRDGSTRPVLYNASVYKNEAGDVLGVFAAARDITERRKAEAEREQYFKLFQNSSDLMVIADPNGAFMKVNPACTETLGYSESELVAKPFIDFVYPDDKQSTIEEMVRQLQRGFSLNFENRYVCKDGSLRWLSWRAYYNRADGLTYATARDITEGRLAEEELMRLSQRNEMILNSAGEGIYGTDVDGSIVFINPAAAEMLGYGVKELIGAKSHQLFHHTKADGRSYPVEECPLHRSLTEGEVRRGREEVFWRRDGSRFDVEHVNSPLVEDGKITGAVVVFGDVTEHKKAEEEIRALNERLEQRVAARTAELQKKSGELEEANNKLKELDQLKSLFIASMSHELRTPLNSIIGFSSITLEEWTGPLNDEQKKNLSAVLRSGRHLLSLINDVIDISKIEAGKHEILLEDFDLGCLIEDGVSMFRKEIEEKGLELQVESPHFEMSNDRRRLLQCLMNLLSNALKFTERGRIEIRINLVKSSKGLTAPDIVEIIVSDTGIGMKKEDLPKLFSAFTRIPSPLSAKVRGTGLGLYLVKKIATEILLGDITVQSEFGEGSSFCLRIPAKLRKGEKR